MANRCHYFSVNATLNWLCQLRDKAEISNTCKRNQTVVTAFKNLIRVCFTKLNFICHKWEPNFKLKYLFYRVFFRFYPFLNKSAAWSNGKAPD